MAEYSKTTADRAIEILKEATNEGEIEVKNALINDAIEVLTG